MTNIIATDAGRAPRSMGIKNLLPGLVERGKIKIGNKGQKRTSKQGNEFQAPQKLDHFLITSMARGTDNNFLRDDRVHSIIGERPVEIPVVLLYDDIELNFQTRYACYNGRSLWCSGDGETARRMTHLAVAAQGNNPPLPAKFEEVSCICHRQAPDYQGRDKCKINGTLSVMIQGVDVVGGVWKFRTTSYNSVVGIMSSLALIKRITGGPLAGIPMMMTLQPKTVTDPVNGGQQVVYVVGLEYRGAMESLQNMGYQTLLTRQQHNIRIEQIEHDAKRLLSADPARFAAPDDVEEELEEFYPESGREIEQSTADHSHANDNKPVNDLNSFAASQPAADLNAIDAEIVVDAAPEPAAKPEPRRRKTAAPQPEPETVYDRDTEEQPANNQPAPDTTKDFF